MYSRRFALMLNMNSGISVKEFAKKILRRARENRHLYRKYLKFFRQRNDSGRSFQLFLYFLYKTIREYTLFFSNEIVSTNGYRLKLIPNDTGISEELKIFKIHEPITTELIKKNVKEGMVCIDLGCNLGYYAILESKLVGKTGKVIAFEPSPLTFKFFKENLSLNEISNVDSFNVAIGDVDGTIKFLVTEQSNWSTVIQGDLPEYYKGRIIDVPLVTLDNFSKNHHVNKIDFIRMDIEGYEDKVIQGMTEIIKKFKPDLYLELHIPQMGIERTTKFLKKLQDGNYELEYYVPRIADTPWISDIKKDVIKSNISEFIKKLSDFSDFNISLYLKNH